MPIGGFKGFEYPTPSPLTQDIELIRSSVQEIKVRVVANRKKTKTKKQVEVY